MAALTFSSTAEEVTEGVSLHGKTMVVTGVNSGLGLESARVLGLRGAHIVGLARTSEKARAALGSVDVTGDAVACDLADPSSVRAAIAAIKALDREIDVVLCNAGIMALPERDARFGIELQLLTNHFGHFALTTGLLGHLADDGRVVVVSSGAHYMAPDEGIRFDDLSAEKHYEPWMHYGQSKLANVLFARSLHQRFEGTSKVASTLHPGVIKTNLGRHAPEQTQAFWDQAGADGIKSIAQGAATQCFLAAHPEGAQAAGRYYADSQPRKTSRHGRDDALAERLWKVSEEMVSSW